MQAGNVNYESSQDIPKVVPLFPLSGVMLLPGGQLPLNIFEPRYLAMVDHALKTDRLIGMIQNSGTEDSGPVEGLYEVGSLGRLTAYEESGDGRYLINLTGVCRFRIINEVTTEEPFRSFTIAPFAGDLKPEDDGVDVDREQLLKTLQSYLDINEMQMDWSSVEKANNEMLVNALSMMSPCGPAEKQALLEAPDLKTRADTLIAVTEIELARTSNNSDTTLQ